MRTAPALLAAVLLLTAAPATAAPTVEAQELGGHRSAFVCSPAAGVTRYVLDRSNDPRIMEKDREGVYIERRDGTGYWRILLRREVRVVLTSAVPLRAVHGLGVNDRTDGYSRVEDLPKRNGKYVVPVKWRTRATVLTTRCAS